MSNYNYYGEGRTMDFPGAFSTLMRNVYTWMAAGLGMTALTAMIMAQNAELMYTIATTPMLMWGMLIAEVVMVIYLSARIMKMSFVTAGIVFALYAILNGATMSFIFMIYTMESIATTFFITAGTFACMSLVGYTVKKDLSAMGRVLLMMLIGIIIATLVNIFVASSGLAMILNYAGVLVFVGLTAYDTQKIKQMMQAYSDAGINDQTNKLALMGSLSLYLDFVNLFLYLLRLFGSRRD